MPIRVQLYTAPSRSSETSSKLVNLETLHESLRQLGNGFPAYGGTASIHAKPAFGRVKGSHAQGVLAAPRGGVAGAKSRSLAGSGFICYSSLRWPGIVPPGQRYRITVVARWQFCGDSHAGQTTPVDHSLRDYPGGGGSQRPGRCSWSPAGRHRGTSGCGPNP